jgi:cytoskeletal protein RodZ
VESLGNKLKTAREEKDLTYGEVSKETNITIRYLEALEKEDFSVFPGEPYALGFLKNYGEYLGLNPEELNFLYRSLKIQEQPAPVEQLLRDPSPVPKILKWVTAILAILAVIGGGAYIIYRRFPRGTAAPPMVTRTASEYVLNTDFMERRFYTGDSILVTEGTNSYKLVFSSLSDAVTIMTPGGPVMLDLAQEVTLDLNSDGFPELRIIAADFAKNDNASGALLRFEQEKPPQTASVSLIDEIPLESLSAGREPAMVLFSSPNAYPFTLQVVFQGYCLFRYEILFERDRPGRNEQYYQRSEELSLTAQNGIRLGISNARAIMLQVIAGGRTMPLEVGGPGEVVAADLRWVRDEDNQYSLALIRLE